MKINAKALLVLMVILTITVVLAIDIDRQGTYSTIMVCTKTDRDTDVLTLETSTGFIYEAYGCEDIEEGDLCAVTLFNNGTEIITDDRIIDLQYGGYFIENGNPKYIRFVTEKTEN